ncbi:MAG TPA: hypothetical protein VMC62_02830 [Longilinea sp.]|nr:hypothetical protein [Longilinea sp.]
MSTTQPRIDSPKQGTALQGVVAITGNTDIDGFKSSEVDFSFDNGSEANWFTISSSGQPVHNGTLANWDTTTISDSTYRLRVVVFLQDGSQVEAAVGQLLVQNYSTPLPTKESSNPVVTVVATQAITPVTTAVPTTPTAMPANPAEVTTSGMTLSLITGAAFTLVIFILLGLYLGFQKAIHRR